jgi:hypothetical protein
MKMNDVTCGMCGDPWEYYYLTHELAEAEKKKVLRGKGCPCCDWGESDRATGEYQTKRVRSIANATDLDPVKYI